MKTIDFDFNLPSHLIAQTPLENRETSRLMVCHRASQEIEHRHFYDVLSYFQTGDVLVLNDTKVYPARLYGTKVDTQTHIEILILKIEREYLECMVKRARGVKLGTQLQFSGILELTCIEVLEQGLRRFSYHSERPLLEVLSLIGEMPLPPYIKTKLTQQDRYQTVYAKHVGSAAAPTAGLHFTQDLLKQVQDKGVKIVYLTLHVGLGTFKPVETEHVHEHVMHAEVYHVSAESADILNEAKQRGKRIIAVGTTSVRTLETQMTMHGYFKEEHGSTRLFINPGFEFKAIDALITNFHLPKSSLVMLVSAFASREFVLHAYQKAIDEAYRFFSFGDAMLLL
jgi:S-adenosylmethionine:tRNA ribosyltransferase-isomerase